LRPGRAGLDRAGPGRGRAEATAGGMITMRAGGEAVGSGLCAFLSRSLTRTQAWSPRLSGPLTHSSSPSLCHSPARLPSSADGGKAYCSQCLNGCDKEDPFSLPPSLSLPLSPSLFLSLSLSLSRSLFLSLSLSLYFSLSLSLLLTLSIDLFSQHLRYIGGRM
jgi:hypothetical protein